MAGRTSNPAQGDAIVQSARAGEPDRYLAALLAPAPARPQLLALAAFLSELARVGAVVSDPAIGAIRLQWWRDALEQPAGTRTGNPIADAVRDLARARALPRTLFAEIIDGCERALLPDAIGDDAALEAHLWSSEGLAFVLGARVLASLAQDELEPAAALAGRAYGLCRLLIAMPRALARGRLPLPPGYLAASGVELAAPTAGGPAAMQPLVAELSADARRHLAACRQRVAKLPREVGPAFLPLAVVSPYLRLLERWSRNPIGPQPQLAPLSRLLWIARVHWLGRS
jgi:15-cis-phytoene synthase